MPIDVADYIRWWRKWKEEYLGQRARCSEIFENIVYKFKTKIHMRHFDLSLGQAYIRLLGEPQGWAMDTFRCRRCNATQSSSRHTHPLFCKCLKWGVSGVGWGEARCCLFVWHLLILFYTVFSCIHSVISMDGWVPFLCWLARISCRANERKNVVSRAGAERSGA